MQLIVIEWYFVIVIIIPYIYNWIASPPSPQAQVVEHVPPPVWITFPDGTPILSDQGNKFWSQALKEPDKKMVLSIVLSAVTNALRERPEDIILYLMTILVIVKNKMLY